MLRARQDWRTLCEVRRWPRWSGMEPSRTRGRVDGKEKEAQMTSALAQRSEEHREGGRKRGAGKPAWVGGIGPWGDNEGPREIMGGLRR